MGPAPSRIIRDSYIQGPGTTCNDHQWFKTNGITHVVSICDVTVSPLAEIHEDNIIHLSTIHDHPFADLYTHLERTSKFIHKARVNGGKVYVHCAAGISRSSTVTIAYFCAWFDITPEEALELLKIKRSYAQPNDGFLTQLKKWYDSEERKNLHQWMIKYCDEIRGDKGQMQKDDLEMLKEIEKDQKPVEETVMVL
eukprot:TRINITY_DN6318_c0_g1_i1.p1 TRINITY_DN6318_c0_g1~~TRINITY_DN6318_c0_g1_i1.p1  ORF type:complete len:196 (-),score=30.18 TRINITY_DN6318_c0_g1_i1:82-669(-)